MNPPILNQYHSVREYLVDKVKYAAYGAAGGAIAGGVISLVATGGLEKEIVGLLAAAGAGAFAFEPEISLVLFKSVDILAKVTARLYHDDKTDSTE